MERKPTSASERELYWTSIIEEARRYPSGVAAFCEERGINYNTYYGWFKRLRSKHPDWNDLTKDKLHRAKRVKAKRAKAAEKPVEVQPKKRRRTFSRKQKERILRETDNAQQGQVAAILRREGLYASTLKKWREERENDLLQPKRRGPKTDSQEKRIKSLEQENERLKKKLKHKDLLLDLQKKISEILETTDE